MKQLLKIILLLPLLVMAACNNSDEPTPVKRTPRTVLVYMASNNSLSGFDSYDLHEMQAAAQAGYLGDSRLLIYHHPRTGSPMLKEVTTDGGIKTLRVYGRDTLSVDSKRMLEVIDDTKRMAPADNYGLILWSHGQGWLQNGIEDDLASKGGEVSTMSFGSDGSHKMNVTTLAATLEGQGFDYVYFDCCFMMGIEVVYQMRNVAQTIVGSVMELPADGMPYDLNLRYLMPETPDFIAAARTTFDLYDSYTGSARTCAMSVVDTSELDNLAAATREVFQTSTPLPDDFTPQEFMMRNLYVGGQCYIYDFEQYVEAKSPDSEVYKRWRQSLAKAVPYAQTTPKIWNNIDVKHYCGLSTFILKAEQDADFYNYKELDWYRDVARYAVLK